MRVFVTGATGWVGSAVVSELLSAGHEVTGMTTSAAGAQKLQKQGARARVARLGDHTALREEAGRSDGVIHTAFIHGLHHMSLATRLRLFAGALNGGIGASFMRILAETETGAVRALGAGLEGTGRPLVVTSGLLFLPAGKVSTERDDHPATGMSRAFSENAALDFIGRGVRACVVRLAPTVHGDGDHGFVAQFVKDARKKGRSPYVGDGANRWPAVHRRDAAKLFRLALEKGEAGAKYHGVDEGAIAFRDIAATIADNLHVPCVGVSAAEAGKHFGMLGMFVGLDNPSSSAWTRDALAWAPEQTGLLADMKAHYFKQAT